MPLEASVPMCGFLEQLPADRCLKFLDLSDSWQARGACSVNLKESSLQESPAAA